MYSSREVFHHILSTIQYATIGSTTHSSVEIWKVGGGEGEGRGAMGGEGRKRDREGEVYCILEDWESGTKNLFYNRCIYIFIYIYMHTYINIYLYICKIF